MLYDPVCMPPRRGDIYVFCALFRFPNVGREYNEHVSLCNCSFFVRIMPSDLCLFGNDLLWTIDFLQDHATANISEKLMDFRLDFGVYP